MPFFHLKEFYLGQSARNGNQLRYYWHDEGVMRRQGRNERIRKFDF